MQLTQLTHEPLIQPPGLYLDTINLAGPLSRERVAVILFGDLAVIFNVARLDGRPHVERFDIRMAGLRIASCITIPLNEWERARAGEYFHYRIEDALTIKPGGYEILNPYTPPERARRIKALDRVMDEIIEFGWSPSAYELSTKGV